MKTNINMRLVSAESSVIREKKTIKSSITTTQAINRKAAMNAIAMPKRKNEIIIE